MKTVKIYKSKRQRLYDYAEYGETLDDTINRLLDEADLPLAVPDKVTNVNVSDATLDRLKSLKENSESIQGVIVRALDKVEKKE